MVVIRKMPLTITPDLTKICIDCKVEKPLDEFYAHRMMSDGREQKCKICRRAYQTNNRIARGARKNKDYTLRSMYKITIEEYEAFLAAQNYMCKICLASECSTGRNFAVDHNHTTGRVRGLLCSNCNRAVGLLGDHLDNVLRLVDYLSNDTGKVF